MAGDIDFCAKRITDPVHGTICLSKAEVDVIGTRTFQRLHNVRQLGLTHLVFPGANYSRFAHSLGACHIASRLLDAIRQNYKDGKLTDRDVQRYRLAALLHDVGHYPFSHSTEHAIKHHYAGAMLKEGTASAPSGSASSVESPIEGVDVSNEPPFYDHEVMGRKLLEYDRELGRALTDHGFTIEDIKEVFGQQRPGSLMNLISSDLDCDRLDYLMRTAHHAGMPYGAVDLNYIIQQATIDEDGQICFRTRALKAADHLLISRYFDYQQVPFHKTVVGLELLLERVLQGLFELGQLRCSSVDMLGRIANGDWHTFDDQHLVQLFREFSAQDDNRKNHPDLVRKIHCILERNPPKLVAAFERLARRGESDAKLVHSGIIDRTASLTKTWSKELGISEDRWLTWQTAFPLTKVDSEFTRKSGRAGDVDELEAQRAVRLLADPSKRGGTESRLIMEFDQSLMKQLASSLYYGVRLYLVPDEKEDTPKIVDAVRTKVRQEFRDVPFLL